MFLVLFCLINQEDLLCLQSFQLVSEELDCLVVGDKLLLRVGGRGQLRGDLQLSLSQLLQSFLNILLN